ncbi:MAG: flagellar hook-basal body complex protein FliE [Deltaproteobacteria bacterium]|nr:flagellar hook-basal body complex protein FliE [Deltaproteobacteria bacterium]MBW2469562.1 flagellar hook-basal body complex protein FliE [Deltaproteobacteria bacterium]
MQFRPPFKDTMLGRNKAIDAYEKVMRMQV